ncbi:MAG: GntR family transcriptional regulator [Deltaproteobacteria bacterium]|nr:GntR family transcriptional regulator [Deltaproteobacteria bacterium]MBW2121660.1 GntR family transcriptional regulator [Deltaproteobacteria bacterium]
MASVRDIRFNLNRETLVDRIVGNLEDRILTGELLPGTRLSEVGVAREFRVSRAPAREALQRLEEMNLVRRTHLTREVAKFSHDEFRDIYELKNVVEAFGAMKGALNATKRDVKRIQSVLEGMRDSLNTGNLKKLQHLNFQFHDLLVNCSGNQKLFETYRLLARQVRWAASFSLDVPGRPQESFREHQEIFEAFQQRRAEEVRALLETHSNNNMQRVLAQLDDRGRHRKGVDRGQRPKERR